MIKERSFQGALSSLTNAISSEPTVPDGCRLRASARGQGGDLDGAPNRFAVRGFRKTLEPSPDHDDPDWMKQCIADNWVFG